MRQNSFIVQGSGAVLVVLALVYGLLGRSSYRVSIKILSLEHTVLLEKGV